MTYDIEQRDRVEVTPLGPGRALVVGSYDGVRAHLARLSRAGRLVEAAAPVPVDGRAGTYQATVRQLREVRPVVTSPAYAPRWYHDWRAVASVAAACVVALGGVVWLAYVVLSWIVAALVAAAPILLGLLVLIILTSAGGGGGGTFSGTFSGRWR